MSTYALAAVFVVAVWWLSTALVLRLVWWPRSTHAASVVVSSTLGLAALFGAAWSSGVRTEAAAYVGFVSGLVVWGWHELTFLLGLVTGPRKTPCPPAARGWSRFRQATETVIHHELALALTALLLVAIAWGQPNQVAAGTFVVLWIMRLSAKLNVFLGVRNVSTEFVPERLRYLLSYFRRARGNPLLPLSLVAATVATGLLAAGGASAAATRFDATASTLLAALLALGLLEHLFLALPVPDAALWRWVLPADGRPASDGPSTSTLRPSFPATLAPPSPGKLQRDV